MKIDLLAPRYEIIADYPDSEYKIGQIISGFDFPINKDSFPAIFRKLQWWEHRKPEEMPEYIKHGENGKPRKIESFTPTMARVIFEGGRVRTLNHEWLPATEAEYTTYINQSKK